MSKLPLLETSIFTQMSLLAQEYNAINLSQGFPNFPVDENLINLVKEKATGAIHQYTPMMGLPALIEKVSFITRTQYQRAVQDKNILITAGATQGIFSAIIALVSKEDEVILLEPCYDCYETPILLSGAKPVFIPLQNNFRPDWGAIEAAITAKTKLLILNNPHNPSGILWEEEDFVNLEKIVDKNPQLLLLSDEVYEYITYEKKHISIHQRPKLIDSSIIVSSFGKTLHITGWKVGYLIAPELLLNEIKKVHQFVVFSVNSVSQHVISDYLEQVDLKTLGSFYKTKRDIFCKALETSRFKLLPCEGSYFQLASYASISNEGDVDFCKRMVREYGVAAIPISVFYKNKTDNKLIRFCFAKDDETLKKASEILINI